MHGDAVDAIGVHWAASGGGGVVADPTASHDVEVPPLPMTPTICCRLSDLCHSCLLTIQSFLFAFSWWGSKVDNDEVSFGLI